MHAFLSNLAHRQTDRQTNVGVRAKTYISSVVGGKLRLYIRVFRVVTYTKYDYSPIYLHQNGSYAMKWYVAFSVQVCLSVCVQYYLNLVFC